MNPANLDIIGTWPQWLKPKAIVTYKFLMPNKKRKHDCSENVGSILDKKCNKTFAVTLEYKCSCGAILWLNENSICRHMWCTGAIYSSTTGVSHTTRYLNLCCQCIYPALKHSSSYLYSALKRIGWHFGEHTTSLSCQKWDDKIITTLLLVCSVWSYRREKVSWA